MIVYSNDGRANLYWESHFCPLCYQVYERSMLLLLNVLRKIMKNRIEATAAVILLLMPL